MKLSDLQNSALQLNELYEQLEIKRYGRTWTTQELALGFVGDAKKGWSRFIYALI